MRLFLDANVLFTAAHNPRGKAALVISTWVSAAAGRCARVALPSRRRAATSHGSSPTVWIAWVRSCAASGWSNIEPSSTSPKGWRARTGPSSKAALACRATHLLTGDLKDFGRFMNRPDETLGVRVQTVAEFLDEVGQPGSVR